VHILVVLNSLNIGGAENYTIGLINQFVLANHQVKLVVLSNELTLRERLSDRVEITVLPRKFKLDICVILELRKIIMSNTFDGIISSFVIYQKIALLFSRLKIPVVYPIHSTVPRNHKEFIFAKFIYSLKGKNDVFLTSIDGQTSQLIILYKLSKDFFDQVLNGIDTDYFSICPTNFQKKDFLSKFFIPEDHKVILMVAGFREEKRHIDAILAFQLLKCKYSKVSLICVGNNNQISKQNLEKYIRLNEISDVILLSASEAGEVRNFYWSCDLFTLTSDKVETFSISALEALSCGKPCVLTNIGGASNFISNMKNGYLISPRNIEGICDGWLKVLENSESFRSEELHKFVSANYSIKNSAYNYIDIIKRKTV